jgi:prepilin-type N-terminal cleavage/methylation domain-containing protein
MASRKLKSLSGRDLKKDDRGFTIIELMIATAVLSVMLLLVTVVMLNIGVLYYKGISQSRVQDDTRSIMDEISQQLQLSDQTLPAPTAGPHGEVAYCIGDARYTVITGVEIGKLAPGTPTTYPHVLWRDTNPTPGSCPLYIHKNNPSGPQVDLTDVNLATDDAANHGTELLSGNSRLINFAISTTSPFTVSVGVAYGSDDLLCSPSVPNSCDVSGAMPNWSQYQNSNVLCKGLKGNQFCSTAHLQSTVVQRL